ncbi:MAG: hypothetical protein JWQ32_1171 [Marmoricola sp.]|nr:hypothetical protein [Marmoricola sp.]
MRVIPDSEVRRVRDSLLRQDWDLPYIVVHADGRSGRLSHTGPYATEVAALSALDALEAGGRRPDASLARLHPPGENDA